MTFALFAAPSILLLLLLTVSAAVRRSAVLRNGDLIDAGSFVGLRNYTGILTSPSFWHAAQFTVIFTLVGVFGSWAVGLGLGLLLRPGVPARGTLKVLLLLPWVVPIVVSSTSWNWLVATPRVLFRCWRSTSASAMSSSWPTLRSLRSPSASSRCGSASRS